MVRVQQRPGEYIDGAASARILGSLSGPTRRAAVLHSGQDAVYLDVDGACLAVLSSRAVLVPCGVRTRRPRLPMWSPGDRVTVGGGGVELTGLTVSVTQVIDTSVGVLLPAAVDRGADLLRLAARDQLARALSELPEGALQRLEACDGGAVTRLLGFGGGLTPLGDDVLAGWLAAAVATRHPALAAVRSGVTLLARRRTTTLSATLLECAALGEGLPQFRALLRGLATGHPGLVERSVGDLLDVGDTSGAGLVLGALTALESLTSLSPSPQGASR